MYKGISIKDKLPVTGEHVVINGYDALLPDGAEEPIIVYSDSLEYLPDDVDYTKSMTGCIVTVTIIIVVFVICGVIIKLI